MRHFGSEISCNIKDHNLLRKKWNLNQSLTLKYHKDFQVHSPSKLRKKSEDNTATITLAIAIIIIIIRHYISSALLFPKAPASKTENKNKTVLKWLILLNLLKLESFRDYCPHSFFIQGKPEAQRPTCKWSPFLMAETGLETGNINSQASALNFIPPKIRKLLSSSFTCLNDSQFRKPSKNLENSSFPSLHTQHMNLQLVLSSTMKETIWATSWKDFVTFLQRRKAVFQHQYIFLFILSTPTGKVLNEISGVNFTSILTSQVSWSVAFLFW